MPASSSLARPTFSVSTHVRSRGGARRRAPRSSRSRILQRDHHPARSHTSPVPHGPGLSIRSPVLPPSVRDSRSRPKGMPGTHRVGGGLTPPVPPHHRTYGSVSGGSPQCRSARYLAVRLTSPCSLNHWLLMASFACGLPAIRHQPRPAPFSLLQPHTAQLC